MPDYWLLAGAVLLSAVTAGAAFSLLVIGQRTPTARWRRIAWIWCIGAGMYAGCGLLGEWPQFPPTEDRDRLLTILLPLTLVVESAAAWVRSRAFAWVLRCILAASVAPILLFNTVYLANLAGPNSAEWPPSLAAAILLFLAATLAGAWALLASLPSKELAGPTTLSLAIVTLCTGATVMLTGYFRGGTLALPLAGAIAGAAIAWRLTPNWTNAHADRGAVMILLFSILIVGRFFGSMPTIYALILFLSPLLNWLAAVPLFRKLPVRWGMAAQLAFATGPAVAIAILAQLRFTAAFQ